MTETDCRCNFVTSGLSWDKYTSFSSFHQFHHSFADVGNGCSVTARSTSVTRRLQVENGLQAASNLRPDDVDGLRLLAWFYATSPGTDKELANAEAAAERACDLTAQQDAACLEAMAAVRARQVNWDGAVEVQCQAVALASGDGAVSRLAAYREKLLPEKGSYLKITELAPAPIPPAERETAKRLASLRQRPAPGIALNLQHRGWLLAVCRKWGPAAANLALVSQSRSAGEDWFELGCLLWLSGDKAGYQKWCQRAMTVDDTQAIRLVSVTPDSGVLPATAMAGWAWMGNAAEFRERTHINALAHYRAGRYDDAIAMLNQTLPFHLINGPDDGPWKHEGIGLKWQLRALIDAREGRLDQAKVAADQARLLVPHNLPLGAELSPGLFGIWLEYQVLHVELQGMLDEKP